MFNDKYGLTNAVLQGRKMMTRRFFDYEKHKLQWDDMCRLGSPCFDTFNDYLLERASKYKIGEVLAVAQAYETMANSGFLDRMLETSSTFKKEYCGAGWSNKMFVRADLMPHQIRITDIKVERLQDISDEDCLREGVTFNSTHWIMGYEVENLWNKFDRQSWFRSARCAFAALIDAISGKGTWESNPYNCAYSFELLN